MAQAKKKPRASRARMNSRTEELTGRQQQIAEAAYYKAEKRGFAPGQEEQDWFEAEAEIDAEEPAS